MRTKRIASAPKQGPRRIDMALPPKRPPAPSVRRREDRRTRSASLEPFVRHVPR